MQMLSDLLAQTLAVQSTMAKTAAATVSLLQSNLLSDTMSSLSQSTQLIQDGHTDLLATVLGNFTACLRRAASQPKTFFKVFRYSTPPAANATAPTR